MPKSTTVLLMLALHTYDEEQSRSRKARFNPYILPLPKARKETCSEEHEISSFCSQPSTPGDHFKAKPESMCLPGLRALTSHQLHMGIHTSFDDCSDTGAQLFLLFIYRVKPHFPRPAEATVIIRFQFYSLCSLLCISHKQPGINSALDGGESLVYPTVGVQRAHSCFYSALWSLKIGLEVIRFQQKLRSCCPFP